MGVNLGDVLIESDDILGDGVNVAARLEAIGEPGGVCVSGSAYEHVQGRVAADFVDLGETDKLKNIAKSVGLCAAAGGDRGGEGRAAETTEPKSVKPRRQKRVRRSAARRRARGAAHCDRGRRVAVLNANRPASVATKTPAEAARLSIVVLPFANLSGNPGQDYFADGVYR